MARQKAQRIAEANNLPNIFSFENAKPDVWSKYFGNDNPIILEIGCGTGVYARELATLFPERNYIGIDYQGERLWQGATNALENKQTNVAFVRGYVDAIVDYFSTHSINEIWITFPDPQPRGKWAKKRLTAPAFLERYRTLLKPDGVIHLKTDNHGLFLYTEETIQREGWVIQEKIEGIYNHPHSPELDIKTVFESRYLQEGKPIHYLRFSR